MRSGGGSLRGRGPVAVGAGLAVAAIVVGCGSSGGSDRAAATTVPGGAATTAPGEAATTAGTAGTKGTNTATTATSTTAARTTSTTAASTASTTAARTTSTTAASTASTTSAATTGRHATTTPRGDHATTTARGTSTTKAPPAARTTTTPAVKIPAARAKLGRTRTWSGTGDRVLGTLTLKRSSVVRWTVSGGRLALRDAAGKLAISGSGKTGQSFAAAGTYRAVKVIATGRWTLSVASLGS